MRLRDLEKKQVVIFGFGREGRATFEMLRTHDIAAVVTDEQALAIPEFRAINAITWNADTVVIKSPGISPNNAALQKMIAGGAAVTSSTNIFFAERKGRGKIIAITGTKGKSTTASLLAHAIALAGKPVALVGNIGAPAIAELDADDATMFVVEISSYQLADLTTAPDIGVITNVYEEHMDWHGSVEKYQRAKQRMGMIMGPNDTLIYNDAFPRLVSLAALTEATALPFAEEDALLDRLQLKGAHNRENARAVLAVTDCLGIARETASEAFATFTALPHRLEEIAAGELLFVNDSISTTPQSAIAAINVYADRLAVIILGGQDCGYDFCDLAVRLKNVPGVLALVMPGGENVFSALGDMGVAAERVNDLDEAVQKAKEHMRKGNVCLLSPASPSYGQFKNFEERGEKFKAAIAEHFRF